MADDLAARGLIEWTYAAALGPRDSLSISAAEAASRHDLGLRPASSKRVGVWALPVTGSDAVQAWHVFGSLLGLDIALADFSLVRMSSKPPPRPTITEIDRRVFIETVVLIEPRRLSDSDRDAIVTAVRAGRARVKALRSPEDLGEIPQTLNLSGQRQTLLAWTIAHDPARVDAFSRRQNCSGSVPAIHVRPTSMRGVPPPSPEPGVYACRFFAPSRGSCTPAAGTTGCSRVRLPI